MSDTNHTILLDRTREVLEEITNHPSGYQRIIQEALDERDWDKLHKWVSIVEAQLAQEHFHKYNLLEDTDVY